MMRILLAAFGMWMIASGITSLQRHECRHVTDEPIGKHTVVEIAR